MGVRIVNTASEKLAKLHASLKPEKVTKKIAILSRELLKAHFYKLNEERHRSDAATGFWAEAAKNTNMGIEGGKISLTVNQIGVRQRYYGGDIEAGAGGSGKKFLTIPARQEAYGHAAGEFNNLAVLYGMMPEGGGIGPVALVEAPQSLLGKKKKKGFTPGETIGGAVMFWLRKKVTQKEDKSVIPTEDQFLAVISEVIDGYVKAAQDNQTPPETNG